MRCYGGLHGRTIMSKREVRYLPHLVHTYIRILTDTPRNVNILFYIIILLLLNLSCRVLYIFILYEVCAKRAATAAVAITFFHLANIYYILYSCSTYTWYCIVYIILFYLHIHVCPYYHVNTIRRND